MVQGIVGAVLLVAGLGLAFFLPVVFVAGLILAVPAVLAYFLYWSLLRSRDQAVARANKVLIIDDDFDSARVTAAAFSSAGWTTDIATTPAMALDYLFYGEPSLVVLDWVLSPALNGRDLLNDASQTLGGRERKNKTTEPSAPVPVVSLSSSPLHAITYDNNEFYQHRESWLKPFNFEEIVSAAARIARDGTANSLNAFFSSSRS